MAVGGGTVRPNLGAFLPPRAQPTSQLQERWATFQLEGEFEAVERERRVAVAQGETLAALLENKQMEAKFKPGGVD